MKVTVIDEQVFKVAKNQMTIGPSASGYSLAYSADGVNFTTYTTAVPANENCIVNGVPQYTYCKLVGNVGPVVVVL